MAKNIAQLESVNGELKDAMLALAKAGWAIWNIPEVSDLSVDRC